MTGLSWQWIELVTGLSRQWDKVAMSKIVSRKMAYLILFLILSLTFCTVLFRAFLARKLRQYEERVSESAAPGGDLGQLLFVEEEEETEWEPEGRDDFLQELSELEGELADWEGLSGLSLRERYKSMAEIWDSELRKIAGRAAEFMEEEDKGFFVKEQKQFMAERHRMSLKYSGGEDGISGSIDYLKSYVEITRDRCYELLEKYFQG